MGELQRPLDQRIKAAQRADSWQNAMTGLGTALDRLRHNHHHASTRSSFQAYETLLADDPLAYRMAHLPAREMMRQGFRLDFGNDAPTELKPALMADFDRLGGASAFIQAITLARGVGGAVVFIGADDGQNVGVELDLKRVRRIRFLKVLSAADLQPRTFYDDPNSDKFGEPETFDVQVTPQGGVGPQSVLLVHESRLLRFDGIVTTDRRRQLNQGWGDSIFIQTNDRIADFWTAAQGLGNALSDADQAVFKLKGLNDIIKGTPEGEEAVRTKLAIMQHGRSVARAVAVDADTEDFKYEARSFSGYDTGLYALMYVVSMSCGIPVTLLFGMSPGGMNATGESDVRFFYDAIKGEQELVVLPRLRRLLEVIFAQKEGPAKGRIPDSSQWSVTFRPLMQSSPSERAAIRLQTAQADAIDIDKGIITAGEAAKSHYSGDEYDQDITLDPDRDLDEPIERPEAEQPSEELADEYDPDQPRDEDGKWGAGGGGGSSGGESNGSGGGGSSGGESSGESEQQRAFREFSEATSRPKTAAEKRAAQKEYKEGIAKRKEAEEKFKEEHKNWTVEQHKEAAAKATDLDTEVAHNQAAAEKIRAEKKAASAPQTQIEKERIAARQERFEKSANAEQPGEASEEESAAPLKATEPEAPKMGVVERRLAARQAAFREKEAAKAEKEALKAGKDTVEKQSPVAEKSATAIAESASAEPTVKPAVSPPQAEREQRVLQEIKSGQLHTMQFGSSGRDQGRSRPDAEKNNSALDRLQRQGLIEFSPDSGHFTPEGRRVPGFRLTEKGKAHEISSHAERRKAEKLSVKPPREKGTRQSRFSKGTSYDKEVVAFRDNERAEADKKFEQ